MEKRTLIFALIYAIAGCVLAAGWCMLRAEVQALFDAGIAAMAFGAGLMLCALAAGRRMDGSKR